MSAGRRNWVAVGQSVLRANARRKLVDRLCPDRAEGETDHVRIGGLSADVARAAANIVSRLPLIAIAHPTYRHVVALDFDSARTLETWILNEPAGAEQELIRRSDPADDAGGPRETKRRWMQVRATLDTVLVRGQNRPSLSPGLDQWVLTGRLRQALTHAAAGDLKELNSIFTAYRAMGWEEIFLDGLAAILSAQIQSAAGIDATLVAYLCNTNCRSALIYTAAEVGASRVSEADRSTLKAVAAHHCKAPKADLILAALKHDQGRPDPKVPLRDQLADRASYRAFRQARLSDTRFIRLALSSATSQAASFARSFSSHGKVR